MTQGHACARNGRSFEGYLGGCKTRSKRASGLLTTGLRTRERSTYHEKKESDQAVTQHRRENTNEGDADRPLSDFAIGGFERIDCVAGKNSRSVPVITMLNRSIITTRRIETGAKLLLPRSILLIQREDQSGKSPDKCQN